MPGLQRRWAVFTPDAASEPFEAFLLFLEVMVFFVLAVSLVLDMSFSLLLGLRVVVK